MTQKPQTPSVYLFSMSLVLILAVVPWGIALVVDSLQPEMLSQTVTAYAPTDSAFRTREVEKVASATSITTFATPEDFYADEVAEQPTLTTTTLPTAEFIQSPVQITGEAFTPLEIYSCPSANPEYQTETQYPAGEEFIVLGWNVDANERVYFLIEDDPSKPQVWIQKTVDVRLSFDDYELRYPAATSCRTWVAVAPTSSTPIVASPTIPLPQAVTATPLPPVEAIFELTDKAATEALEQSDAEIKNPHVSFSEDGIQITGDVELDGPLGSTVDGNLEMKGQFEVREGKLYVDMTSIEVEGRDITNDEAGQQAENMVNNWLFELLVRKDVTGFELQDGELRIYVLERQNSILPTLAVSPTPMQALLPNEQGLILISPEAATGIASQLIPQLTAFEVFFTPEGVQVSGELNETIANLPVGAKMVATGTVGVVEGQLQLILTDLKVNDVPILETEAAAQINTLLNSWLQALSEGYTVSSANVNNGVLEISVEP